MLCSRILGRGWMWSLPIDLCAFGLFEVVLDEFSWLLPILVS